MKKHSTVTSSIEDLKMGKKMSGGRVYTLLATHLPALFFSPYAALPAERDLLQITATSSKYGMVGTHG